jgi:hypothetical protein
MAPPMAPMGPGNLCHVAEPTENGAPGDLGKCLTLRVQIVGSGSV